MNRFVLDASVSVAWFVDQPTPALAIRVRQSLAGGQRAIVPALWHLEMANAFLVAERRGVLSAQDVHQSIGDIEQLLSSVIETRNDLAPVRQSTEMGRSFRLAAYDAVYLGLAQREGFALATLDQKLRAAAGQAGVAILR